MDALTVAVPFMVSALTALAIGLAAALAPCALTSNLAAVAYVTSRLANARQTALAGLAYAGGRALTYTVMGLVIFWLGTEIIESTEVHRTAAGVIFGLLFMVAGAILLEKLKFNFAVGSGLQAKFAEKLYGHGVLGAFGLGVIFALAFCPYMAALFFGALMPLALSTREIGVAMPAMFGIGSALPVLAFALLAAAGVTTIKSYTDRIRQIEPLIRRLFGAVMIVFGAYLILTTIM